MLYYLIGFVVSAVMIYYVPLLFFVMGIAGIYPTYKLYVTTSLEEAGESAKEHYRDSMWMVKLVWAFISIIFWPILFMCIAIPGASRAFIEGMAEGFRATVEINDD